jgi:hypothetical protein
VIAFASPNSRRPVPRGAGAAPVGRTGKQRCGGCHRRRRAGHGGESRPRLRSTRQSGAAAAARASQPPSLAAAAPPGRAPCPPQRLPHTVARPPQRRPLPRLPSNPSVLQQPGPEARHPPRRGQRGRPLGWLRWRLRAAVYVRETCWGSWRGSSTSRRPPVVLKNKVEGDETPAPARSTGCWALCVAI